MTDDQRPNVSKGLDEKQSFTGFVLLRGKTALCNNFMANVGRGFALHIERETFLTTTRRTTLVYSGIWPPVVHRLSVSTQHVPVLEAKLLPVVSRTFR